MLVKVLFAAVSLPAILAINGLVYRVPAGENAQNAGPAGFTVLALVFGIIMIVMFVVMYKRIDGMDPTQKITEERAAARKRGEKVPPLEAGEKVNLFEMIKYWITNLPALIGLFAEIIRFIAQMTIQSMAMYVFTYAFGDVAMAAVMLTAANVTGLVATFVSEPIARKVGIRATYLAGIGISCVSMVACFLVGATGEMAFIVCICAAYFGMNFMNGTMMGMQSNAIAYGEWRDGKTAKAFIMSTFQWCPKHRQRRGRRIDRLRPGCHRLRVRHGGIGRARSGHDQHHLPYTCRGVRHRLRGVLLRLSPELQEDGADRGRSRRARGSQEGGGPGVGRPPAAARNKSLPA